MGARNCSHHPGMAVAILVVTLLAMPILPSHAGILRSPAGDARLSRATGVVDEARSLLRTDRLEDAVRAAAALGRVEPEALPVGQAAMEPAIPASLARPVGRLLSAIEDAGAMVAQAIPRDQRLEVTLRDAMRMSRLISRATTTPPDFGARATLEEWQRTAEDLVDEPKLYSAALVLARALDRSIAELEQVHMPTTDGAAIVGCDVVDLPVVCIGNTGANEYTSDRALVIDLGGDDLHTHTAGGATAALPIAITVDLGGNDRYQRSNGIAQGSGNLGVGMLVDTDGDDSYSIAATSGTDSAAGQGSNFSAGAGLLADFDGNDSYNLSSTRNEAAFAAGQGRAAQPGFGLLLDRGTGSDRYLTSARPAAPVELPTEVKLGGLNANGLGLGGVGGVGILSDEGGTDEMTLETISPPIAPDEVRPVTQIPVTGPTGMGTGLLGGAGLLLSGPGDTIRTTTVSMDAPVAGIATSNVFGRGFQALGALVDEGGNDVYSATATVRATRHVTVRDDCGCSGSLARSSMALPNVAAVSMSAMGVGTTGVGILRDEAGNDTYRATAQAIASSEIHDQRTSFGPEGAGSSAAIALANAASLTAQGAGQGGVGSLEDLSGNDDYSALVSSRASAVADAVSPEVRTEATSRSDLTIFDGQAAGVPSGGIPGLGLLRDDGGLDRYAASAESSSSASPETFSSVGEVKSSAQGSVTGKSSALLYDVDDGSADVFALTPPDPACTGVRGTGTWQDCGDGVGMGIIENRT